MMMPGGRSDAATQPMLVYHLSAVVERSPPSHDARAQFAADAASARRVLLSAERLRDARGVAALRLYFSAQRPVSA